MIVDTKELITLSEFAQLIGVYPSAVTNWKNRHPEFPAPAWRGYYSRNDLLDWYLHHRGYKAMYETIAMPDGHGPKKWTVVSDSPLIVSAMCICGNDECAFTVNASDAVNTNLNYMGWVKL